MSFQRKLMEAWRYALDPLLIARHGPAALRVDGITLGKWRLPAPRQLSALCVTMLWALAVVWGHMAGWAAAGSTCARGLWVVRKEGIQLAEVPAVVLEQALEPVVLTCALLAGACRVLVLRTVGHRWARRLRGMRVCGGLVV